MDVEQHGSVPGRCKRFDPVQLRSVGGEFRGLSLEVGLNFQVMESGFYS